MESAESHERVSGDSCNEREESLETINDKLIAQYQMKSDLINYIRSKTTQGDWHAVSDAANDLRVIDKEIEILQVLNKS